jgi:heat shock protein HslJ
MALLGSEPAYTLEGSRLTLRSERTIVVLLDREVADPDRPLVGTTWRLSGQHEGGGDDGIARSASGATVRFDADRVTVTVEGCGEGAGTAEIGERTIRLPKSYAMATATCSEREREVHGLLTRVLTGTVTFEIEAGQLTVERPDGEGLSFRSDD